MTRIRVWQAESRCKPLTCLHVYINVSTDQSESKFLHLLNRSRLNPLAETRRMSCSLQISPDSSVLEPLGEKPTVARSVVTWSVEPSTFLVKISWHNERRQTQIISLKMAALCVETFSLFFEGYVMWTISTVLFPFWKPSCFPAFACQNWTLLLLRDMPKDSLQTRGHQFYLCVGV